MAKEIVSHYEILERLGSGGMGVVFKAFDTRLERHVALKFLPTDLTRDPTANDRFTREARSASALDHPNICTIYDIEQAEDGRLFIAMAFYDGETLKARVARGPLEVQTAVDIALQVTRGLERAHRAGLVHRDIKPANVMLTEHGVVKVLDFGLAKLAGEARQLTSPGQPVGTAAYMSPEQGRGDEVDERTDLWSLGCVLYEMLAGKPPFRGEHGLAVLSAVLMREPPPLGEVRPEVPAELDRLVGELLAKDPEDRPASATDVGARLAALGQPLSQAETRSERVPVPRPQPASRGWLLALVAAAALLVAIAAIVGLRFLPGSTPRVPTAPGSTTRSAAALDATSRAVKLMDQVDNPQRVDLAADLLRRAIEADPGFALAHAELALALVEEPKAATLPEAEAEAQRAIELAPDLAIAKIALAHVHLAAGRTQDAIAELRGVIAMHPDSDDAYRLLGFAYWNAKDLAKAEMSFRQAATLKPDAWRHWHELGLFLMVAGDAKGCREALTEAIRVAPAGVTWPRQGLGTLELQQGRYAEAVEVYNGLPRPIVEPQVAANIGSAYFYLGRLADAEQYYRLALRLAPGTAVFHGNLGDLLQTKGDTAGARAEFLVAADQMERLLIVKPDDERLRVLRQLYLAKAGTCPDSLAQAAESAATTSATADNLYQLARSLAVCGRRDASLRVLRLAIHRGASPANLLKDVEFHRYVGDPEFLRLADSKVGNGE